MVKELMVKEYMEELEKTLAAQVQSSLEEEMAEQVLTEQRIIKHHAKETKLCNT